MNTITQNQRDRQCGPANVRAFREESPPVHHLRRADAGGTTSTPVALLTIVAAAFQPSSSTIRAAAISSCLAHRVTVLLTAAWYARTCFGMMASNLYQRVAFV